MGLVWAENTELKPPEVLWVSGVLALVASAAGCSWLTATAGASLQFCPRGPQHGKQREELCLFQDLQRRVEQGVSIGLWSHTSRRERCRRCSLSWDPWWWDGTEAYGVGSGNRQVYVDICICVCIRVCVYMYVYAFVCVQHAFMCIHKSTVHSEVLPKNRSGATPSVFLYCTFNSYLNTWVAHSGLVWPTAIFGSWTSYVVEWQSVSFPFLFSQLLK